MPTKQETQIVSPSRTMAIASLAVTMLFLIVISQYPFGKPLGDTRTQQGLGLSADEYADMPARQCELRIIFGTYLCAERARRRGRNDVVILGEHVENRHR